MRATAYQKALLLSVFLTACTTSPQRVAFNSLQTTRTAVEASIKVFNEGYQAGQFSETQRAHLKDLYGKYLQADRIAATLLQATTEVNVSAVIGDVTVAAGNVISFIQQLKAP